MLGGSYRPCVDERAAENGDRVTIFGLHWIDFTIILGYVAFVLWLGERARRRMKTSEDFFIAGRKIGKTYQFFLNLGTSTSPDQAVVVSREIYRQGIGGMWIQYLVLFLTPFYWFTTFWFRRVRLVTIGDYFEERFRSRFLGAAFAAFSLVMAVIGIGVGYMVAAKTMMALTPKPEARYTLEERRSVEQFREYNVLRARRESTAALTPEEQRRFDELSDRLKRGELRAFISYTNPAVIYAVYAVVVALYTMMGGFIAAVITDVIQGILIIVFSLLLIPVGLARIGGFSGLHATVPGHMFNLFGSTAMGEYAWYTIAAMALANLVSIIASAPGMATAGSAKDEMSARIGMIGGMYLKRFIMIFWALAGLLAIALYSNQLHDPDLIWGYMTRDLLFPGAIGLMLAGVLAGKMSSLAATCVANSALVIQNLYRPFSPGCSDRHYINAGRVMIVVTIAGGAATALYIDNLLELFKYFISIPAIFGAAIWLGFVWRRLTKWAVILQVFLCFAIYAVIPNIFLNLEWARTNPRFTVETQAREIAMSVEATTEDVAAGRAARIGQRIDKTEVQEASAVFFEQVARRDPADPKSVKFGLGRFHAEIWVLSWFGIDFKRFSKAELVAARFYFDALFPFFLLFCFSFFTRPVARADLDRFFARLRTPVQATPEADKLALADMIQKFQDTEKEKIWPGSNWEIYKPGWKDVLGFGGSWLLVGVIVFLLWLMVNLH
jgi:SSS family solute:Na+ symporter